MSIIEVELPIGLGGFTAYQALTNSECYDIYSGVSLRVLRSVGERERTHHLLRAPKSELSC